MITQENIQDFIEGYIACLLWSTNGTTPEGEEFEGLDGFELSPETQAKCETDCREFITVNTELLTEYAQVRHDCMPSPWCHAGHDFWLTRCGHGAGFWDRGLGELGDKLTDAAHACGNLDPYIGDDGKVWI